MTMSHTLDRSCEGVEFTALDAFSVQFHPEAGAGPLDTKFLFDRFVDKVKSSVNFWW